jgi:hypothetical protein
LENHALAGWKLALAESCLRLNPSYELVERGGQDSRLNVLLEESADTAGLLWSSDPSLPHKVVSAEAASVFASRRTLNLSSMQASMGLDCEANLAQLILDGLLEIDAGSGFVSGFAAYEAVAREKLPPSRPGNLLGELSLRAIQYGFDLRLDPARDSLAGRLYRFYRIPASAHWEDKIPGHRDLLDYLGLPEDLPPEDQLTKGWVRVNPEESKGWLVWKHPHPPARVAASEDVYKIYISPLPAELPRVLQLAVPMMRDLRVPRFKIGSDLHAILRPDKLVAYFFDREHALRAARELAQLLSNFPAHGVPFTSAVDASGLVSWAMDPPSWLRSKANNEGLSWRSWLAQKIADHLLRLHALNADRESATGFILHRLEVGGLDPQTWAPGETIWQTMI